MNELAKVFSYDGNNITFQLENGDVMVSLTEMARPFGKKPAHFLENAQTQLFIKALNAKHGISCLKIKRGGNRPGTWGHQKLALKFAGWLSPEFELWVYDKIEELLTTR